MTWRSARREHRELAFVSRLGGAERHDAARTGEVLKVLLDVEAKPLGCQLPAASSRTNGSRARADHSGSLESCQPPDIDRSFAIDIDIALAWLRDSQRTRMVRPRSEPFVRELAAEAGTRAVSLLHRAELQYLPSTRRVMALGAAKSRDESELAMFAAALRQVSTFELPENRALLARVVRAGAPDRGGAREAAPATSHTRAGYCGWRLRWRREILAAVLP